MQEIKKFFRIIAFIFIVYVIILSFSYKYISGLEALDYISTIVLVIVISISTFGQYFIGISNSVLLQADQRTYITNIISMVATIVNAVMVVVLIGFSADVIIVKLFSSIIFFLKPVALWLVVKKDYKITNVKTNEVYLKQKTTGLGQHLAYFLHSNTDVVVLTLLSNLVSVAIYSVYHMVVSSIEKFSSSFASGMEALFGNLYAKGEKEELNKTFDLYEGMISITSLILLSTTAVLIVPFIKIYTSSLTDADYIQPAFSLLLTISALLTSLRAPYHNMTIAAGKFKETRVAAYGEALINIILSVILVLNFGLVGVAIGTVAATAFRFIYYVFYLSKNLLYRSVWVSIKRLFTNALTFTVIYLLGSYIVSLFDITNYGIWIIFGFIVVVLSAIVTLAINLIMYKGQALTSLKKILKVK